MNYVCKKTSNSFYNTWVATYFQSCRRHVIAVGAVADRMKDVTIVLAHAHNNVISNTRLAGSKIRVLNIAQF